MTIDLHALLEKKSYYKSNVKTKIWIQIFGAI